MTYRSQGSRYSDRHRVVVLPRPHRRRDDRLHRLRFGPSRRPQHLARVVRGSDGARSGATRQHRDPLLRAVRLGRLGRRTRRSRRGSAAAGIAQVSGAVPGTSSTPRVPEVAAGPVQVAHLEDGRPDALAVLDAGAGGGARRRRARRARARRRRSASPTAVPPTASRRGLVDHLVLEDGSKVRERAGHVGHRDRVATQSGESQRMLVTPVLGRPHGPVEEVVVVVEVAVEELERDAVAVGRMGVQRRRRGRGRRGSLGRRAISLTASMSSTWYSIPEVVGPVPRVQEELVRHEDLEEDPPTSMRHACHVGWSRSNTTMPPKRSR